MGKCNTTINCEPCVNTVEQVRLLDGNIEWHSNGDYVIALEWSDWDEKIYGHGKRFSKSHQIYYDLIMYALSQGDLN